MQVLDVPELEKKANDLRFQILKTTHNAGCGHTGGSLSEADILTVLYFRIMKIDSDDPQKKDRDRFILSKGHATPGFYSALALRGFFSTDELAGFDKLGSILQGHPDMHKTPGVDISSGSLGQGLSLGIGMRLAGGYQKEDFKVYVLVGDGESQEGQVWEAALYAGANKVKGLIGITDMNSIQLSGSVEDTLDLGSLQKKWEAFGWQTLEVDGHDMEQLVQTMDKASELSKNGPVMILARTVKGKGVSFMENDYRWHGKAPDEQEFDAAVKELRGEN